MDEFQLYVALWRRAELDGVSVRYEDDRSESGTNGYFDPHRYDTPSDPEIVIVRAWCTPPGNEPRRESDAPPPLAQPDIPEELITLAHEFGHGRSFLTDTKRWLEYDDVSARLQIVQREASFTAISRSLVGTAANDAIRRVILETLDDNERALIIDEEMRAWGIARETLAEAGYDGWARFQVREQRGLHFHRWRLGIAEALPDA
ncbi:MAG TPA: hypothetical protein VGM88_00905 [Kofleriaceae bacterium]|jgi:hypothetical protein